MREINIKIDKDTGELLVEADGFTDTSCIKEIEKILAAINAKTVSIKDKVRDNRTKVAQRM